MADEGVVHMVDMNRGNGMNTKNVDHPPLSELKRKDQLARNTILLYLVTGLTVAFVTPENIMGYAWAQWFANLMSFIPYVEKVGQASSAHQIAQFFAAVMCVLSVAIILPLWRSLYPLPAEIANRRIRVRQTLKYAGTIFFMVWLLVWVIFYPSFDTRLGRFQINSRIGMGMYGTIILGGMPFISLIVIKLIQNWRHIVYGDMDEIIKQNSKFH